MDRVEEAVAAYEAGHAVRVEVLRPGDMFRLEDSKGFKSQAYQAALSMHRQETVVIPGWLSDETDVGARIEGLLRTAGVEYKRYHTGDWCIYGVQPKILLPLSSSAWVRPRDQAEALLLFKAWSLENGMLESRILEAEVRYLQRLAGCLAGSRQDFEVKWVPGYRPVEARVTVRSRDQWPSHVPVLRVVKRRQDTFRVTIRSAGSVIVSLALVPGWTSSATDK
jgi:hypothetical protein